MRVYKLTEEGLEYFVSTEARLLLFHTNIFSSIFKAYCDGIKILSNTKIKREALEALKVSRESIKEIFRECE